MSKYMPEKRFSFISNAASLNLETFGVVQFTGVEGISIPYEFDIMLVSDDPDLNLDDILESSAKFTIHRKNGGDVDFHGMLNSLEQLHKHNEYIFYRAHLVPRLWWLSITHHNQVCLNKKTPEIVELTLKDSGLSIFDFEFKTRDEYNPQDYVCQYNESHFNFISRWLEREGLYYYFDQKGDHEKIIFTDTYIAHTSLPDVHYAPPSGLLPNENSEIVHSFICRQRQLPQKIYLKDYNYERPSLGISGSANVDQRGRGTDYIYGEYFKSSEEGDRLARIRAEILNCRKREFIGESTIPFIEPGYTFTLRGHYRESFNQQYLVESINHEGNQVGYLQPGISDGLPTLKRTVYYQNSFTTIPADVQFRPEIKAIKPTIPGTIHAVIDAEGSGKYAELDGQGRYKVRLPFDESDDHRSGKASTYLRMMQPYANQKGGMQFPLTKGTEVLLTFIDGDPDRPVIAGAIANPETPSPVSAKNQTESVIQTGGNNKIRFEDKSGKERIIMESPTASSWVRIGAPNDPVPPQGPAVKDNDPGDGIRICSEGNVWIESEGRFASYTAGIPVDGPANLQNLIEKMHKYDDGNFGPKGVLPYKNETPYVVDAFPGTDKEKWQYLVNKGQVIIAKGDTFKTQEGNIYDFRGYRNYNFGKSYEENFMNQSDIVLNKADLNQDKAESGGPNPGSIDCSDIGNLDNDTWISKTIGGASYDYTKDTKKLSVEYGTKEESHTFGKTTYEHVYREDGSKIASIVKNGPDGSYYQEDLWHEDGTKAYSKTIDAEFSTTEETFGPAESGPPTFEYETSPAFFSFKATASAMPVIAVVTSASSNETSISANASTKIDISVVGSLNFSFAGGVGLGMEVTANAGGKCEANLISGEFEGKWLGFKAQKAAALEAKKKELVIDSLVSQIEQKEISFCDTKVNAEVNKFKAQLGISFQGI